MDEVLGIDGEVGGGGDTAVGGAIFLRNSTLSKGPFRRVPCSHLYSASSTSARRRNPSPTPRPKLSSQAAAPRGPTSTISPCMCRCPCGPSCLDKWLCTSWETALADFPLLLRGASPPSGHRIDHEDESGPTPASAVTLLPTPILLQPGSP